MRISIVTISFNQVMFLKKCIDSVVSQKCTDLEYIVVDPGSSDGSRELIDSYAGKVSVRVYERDAGAADGLNKGFAKATGEIFGFLNSDDELLPDALRFVEEFFSSHPEVDVLNGSGQKTDAAGVPFKRIHASPFSVDRYVFGAVNLLQQGCFFRRRVFERVGGFNVANKTCWDGELFLDMALSGARFAATSRMLGAFRIHDASISGSGRMEEEYRRDCERLFVKAKGRGTRPVDLLYSLLLRLEKHLYVLGTRIAGANS